jgi:methylenetetrahydrofolate dehydrogenase (NADP+) / methenyltetrahydrofolate cyclohydrolase
LAEAAILDGKAFADRLCARLTRQVTALGRDHGITPGLAAVLVGDDPASQVYVRNKERRTAACGMVSHGRRLAGDVSLAALLGVIETLNADPAVNGLLVQLPLPPQIDPVHVIDAIRPDKDVDGFHLLNVGALATGRRALAPCTPLGCMMLLEDHLGDLTGLEAVVVGRSNIVGKPLAQMLLAANCTVTIAHSRSRDLPALCQRADILVAAVGRARMIKGGWIKPGATVIDVGINRIAAADGKTRLVGDVAFDEALGVAGAITPVPGGVGPMTIASLLANTLTATCRQHGIEVPQDAAG